MGADGAQRGPADHARLGGRGQGGAGGIRRPRHHRPRSRPQLRRRRPELGGRGALGPRARPDPRRRPGRRPGQGGGRGQPRPADAGPAAARPLSRGDTRHPPGDGRWRHCRGHPRQESSRRRQLLCPGRPAGARHAGPGPDRGHARGQRRRVLGDGRRDGSDGRGPRGDDPDAGGRDIPDAGRYRAGPRSRRPDGAHGGLRRRLPLLGGLDRLPGPGCGPRPLRADQG